VSFKGSPLVPFPEASQAHESLACQGTVQIPGYDLECEIGRGGMATVYRAVQQSLGRRVAIKILALELNDDHEFVERFKKEGRILAQLSHPHIVTIHDIGVSQDNRLFLSIEYLSGGTLKDRIKQGLPVDYTLQIITAIAKALSCAHKKGVIHRDVKPSNIMFRHDGLPVLTDFGVARIVWAKTIYTSAGFIVGSPGYMSPEQAMGEGATIQSDLYGLGVVLYEMLVGRSLYQADNALAIMLKHLNDPIPELPHQYAYLQPILNRLLAKKATERYQNADEFLDAIHLITPGDISTKPGMPITSDHQSIIEFVSGQIQRLSKRKLRFLVGAGIAIIAILAITVGYHFKPGATESIQQPLASAIPVQLSAPINSPTEIAILLQQADKQLKAGLLTESGQRAEATYQQILKQDQNNPQALAGLEAIAKEYERLARQRLEVGELQESLDHANRGLSIAPKLEGLLHLRQDTEQLIAKRNAQKIEQQRQQELQLQAHQWLTQAQSSFQENTLQVSLAYIEQGLLVVPNHPDLLALRDQVKVRIAEQQRQAEAGQQQEEEARLVAKAHQQQEEEEAWRQAKIAERQKAEQARQQAATEQRHKESNQYLARALNDHRKGRYTASLQQIEKGLAIVPNHEGLLGLKVQVREALAAQQQEEAIRRQAVKETKQKESARRQTQAPNVLPNQEQSDEALKKLQNIRNAVDALNKSLDK